MLCYQSLTWLTMMYSSTFTTQYDIHMSNSTRLHTVHRHLWIPCEGAWFLLECHSHSICECLYVWVYNRGYINKNMSLKISNPQPYFLNENKFYSSFFSSVCQQYFRRMNVATTSKDSSASICRVGVRPQGACSLYNWSAFSAKRLPTFLDEVPLSIYTQLYHVTAPT